ncbi:MAG: helix-turn-helix transcriptional regulator [Deltaproteobacteria bacterium]|nr:helix-turn-helix transcriptional regulator [Deltaproteobacteria bacterium]
MKTDFFNDFARPFGMFHALNATFLADAELSASIACHYPRTVPGPTKEAYELLELLMPHMAQAVRFHGRWRALTIAEKAAADAVGRTSTGFLVLDGRGRVLRTNELAEGVLRTGDGLRASQGRLRAVRASDDAELQSAIARVAETALQGGLGHGRTLPIRRVGNDLPYLVLLMPVSAKGSLFGEHRGAVVALVSDPARQPSLSKLRMQRVLGWTQAEAGVAALLLEGRSTREIAESRGVGSETIRAQLKSLYRKAGVSGQAQLVRLLMAGGPALERPQR